MRTGVAHQLRDATATDDKACMPQSHPNSWTVLRLATLRVHQPGAHQSLTVRERARDQGAATMSGEQSAARTMEYTSLGRQRAEVLCASIADCSTRFHSLVSPVPDRMPPASGFRFRAACELHSFAVDNTEAPSTPDRGARILVLRRRRRTRSCAGEIRPSHLRMACDWTRKRAEPLTEFGPHSLIRGRLRLLRFRRRFGHHRVPQRFFDLVGAVQVDGDAGDVGRQFAGTGRVDHVHAAIAVDVTQGRLRTRAR